MNKLTIAIALVSVLVGLVAISSVGANLHKKLHHKHEGGEGVKPHHGHHHGHKVHKGHHPKHEGPEGHKPIPHGHGHKCNCPKFNCNGNRHPGGLVPPHGGEREHQHHHPEGEEGGHGGFEGAGLGFGFRKDKEFDAGVRAEDRERDRGQFQKHQGFVAGESDRFGGGESSSDLNTVEGVHKRKNINNNKLVVSESNRGHEDVDGFRQQSGHSQEGHFAGGESKFVGAESDEAGSLEHDSDREFDAGVHKKEEVEGFGGAGVVKSQF